MNINSILDSLGKSVSTTIEQRSTAINQSNLSETQGSKSNSISSMLPGGLVGGAAAGGVIALLLGSKSTRKMATKVAKFGGTAVLGGLAYKAYGNWQKNKALGQTLPATDQDILNAVDSSARLTEESKSQGSSVIGMILIKTMIAASKADGNIDSAEHKKLFDSIERMGLDASEKAAVFDLLARDITIDEIVESVTLDEQKAEVYLSGYLAIDVDDHAERAFLNSLAIGLNLPKGFAAYLEQQADQGVLV